MKIEQVLKKAGSKNRSKKRVGRGIGSGRGKTSGRGHKGQKSRSGAKKKQGFEGGQMPLIRRIPKRGFNNRFSQKYEIVNVRDINRIDIKDWITPEILYKEGLIDKKNLPVKILGDGDIEKPLNVKAHKFSKSAQKKIKKAGGKVERVETG